MQRYKSFEQFETFADKKQRLATYLEAQNRKMHGLAFSQSGIKLIARRFQTDTFVFVIKSQRILSSKITEDGKEVTNG